jgi:LacI family transcriptional regulator
MSLKALATSLGLSKTTVSRALDGYDDVAAATRERVKAAAQAMNYSPNPVARRLSRGSSETVALVVPGDPGKFYEPVLTEMLAGLGETLAGHGYQLVLMTARPGEEEEKVYRRLMSARLADAAIVVRTRVNDPRIALLTESNFPFVTLGRSESSHRFAFVDGDAEAAFAQATRRLIAQGHRHIALMATSPQFSFAGYRRAGWAKAMAEAGLATDAMFECAPTEEGGVAAASQMLAHAPRATALLCMTDRIAIGAMSAMRGAGVKPGSDIAVIGHDNIPASPYTDPPLATMELPLIDVGRALGDKAIALINGARPEELCEVRPVSLIWRASAGSAA